jgi:pyruvate-formate lyase-activating enzyme
MAADSHAGTVHERRHWVRITAACNNRCCFCLDRQSLDGRLRPRDELDAELQAGRTTEATRLILSGGEPTLHPALPDLIRQARALGYEWVQIITNGRRLAYPAFLQALLDAGLDEVTFSIHGSSPQVHDAMVGVPGAFAQSLAGLRAALDARLVVSVDVVLTRRNLADAPTLVRRTLEAGVREYDILWLTPFGAAAEHLARPHELFLDPADAPAVHRVLETARAGGAVVWTNRIPLAFLEGFEGLVQDPAKLEDELRGRRPMLDALLHDGTPLPCRDRHRCPRCPFGGFCDLLHRTVAVARRERRAEAVRWNPADRTQTAVLGRLPRPASVWLRTDRPAAGWRPESRAVALAARRLRLEAPASVLAACLAELPAHAVLHLVPTALRAWPRPLLRSPHELVVPLTARLARLDPTPLRERRGRLVVADPTAPQGAAGGWPFARRPDPATRRWLRAAEAVEGLPPCLAAGRPTRPRPEPFDLGWLDDHGRLDPLLVLHDFVAEAHRTFSLRCARCTVRRGCTGIPWAMGRDVGLAVLRPTLPR